MCAKRVQAASINMRKDIEHDNTMKTEQNIPLYWLYEKLVALHVRCLNLTVSLKQPIHARY